MPAIVLSNKATKLMKLCEIEGFETLEQLLRSAVSGTGCPAICLTEGCDQKTKTAPNEHHGHCQKCGGNTVTSALVLAGVVWGRVR